MMIISTETNHDNSELTIRVTGRFTFPLNDAFCHAYRKERYNRYIVDLHQASYINTTTIGMLMALRDYVGTEKDMVLIRTNDKQKHMFFVANFQNLFDIE